MEELLKNMSTEGQMLYRKGSEIIDTVNLITDLIPEENEHLQFVKNEILNNALQLQVKVTGAEAVELYDLKMENACIIRKAAHDLWVQKHSLEMFDFAEADYFEIIQNLIEEYRHIFIRWVEKFDKWNYVIDRWGLFNPPGVGPYDKDPDDDIPFQNPFNDFD